MKKTKKKLSDYWDGMIFKNLPSYATFRKMNKEMMEHFNFLKWAFEKMVLPIIIFYIIFGLIFEIDVFGSIFLSLLLFFYSNLLPDVDSLFKKTRNKMLDSLWYEKYSLLFFAPIIIYYIFSGRAKPLYSINKRPFHNFKTVIIYGAFLFVIGSIFWSDILKRVMFPVFGMLGFTVHILIDKKIYINHISHSSKT